MNPWTAFLIFGSYFFIDVIYVHFVRSVSEHNPVKAATCSTSIYLLMAFGVVHYVEQPIYLIPMSIGAWLGTYVATGEDRV